MICVCQIRVGGWGSFLRLRPTCFKMIFTFCSLQVLGSFQSYGICHKENHAWGMVDPQGAKAWSDKAQSLSRWTPAYTLNPTLVISSRYYLGYSNVDQRRSKEDCNCLESKISQKFDNWKIRTISITSKIVFIKSNLTGNPQCVMNCFKFPRYMHNDIGKIIGTSFRMITKNMFLSLFLL